MYYVQICLQKERKNKMGEIIHEMITEKQTEYVKWQNRLARIMREKKYVLYVY